MPTAKDALSVTDFEALARQALPPAHWGYMASGVDDNATLNANINAYSHIELRPRRLVDVAKIDSSIELFGVKWDSPIFLCPVGGQRMFHPDGELATGRAAKAKNALQILSTQTSIAVEEVAKARGTAPWYQLYMPSKWEDAEKLVRRVAGRGLSGDRLDHRQSGRPQSRNGGAVPAHGHARVHQLATRRRTAGGANPADVHGPQRHGDQSPDGDLGIIRQASKS